MYASTGQYTGATPTSDWQGGYAGGVGSYYMVPEGYGAVGDPMTAMAWAAVAAAGLGAGYYAARKSRNKPLATVGGAALGAGVAYMALQAVMEVTG